MPGQFERRRGRGRPQWVEPAERDWCVRHLQHDQVLPLGSLTYRQAAHVVAVLSTVRLLCIEKIKRTQFFAHSVYKVE